MTDLTADGLHQLPSETPRAYIARLRNYVIALMSTMAEDDPQRVVLQAALDEVQAVLDEAANKAGYTFCAALALQMQDEFVQTVEALDESEGDALDKAIPADPEGQAAVARMAAELLASAPQPAAPAVRAPARKLRPGVPARRADADVRAVRDGNAGGAGVAEQVDPAGNAGAVRSQPVAPARVPQALQPVAVPPGRVGSGAPAGATVTGGRPATPSVGSAVHRQPAGAATACRPGQASSLSSLKKASAPAERAEGTVDAAPAQNPRNGKIYADGTAETERTMHIAGGKIVNKTKPAFQVPPLDPEDLAIPW